MRVTRSKTAKITTKPIPIIQIGTETERTLHDLSPGRPKLNASKKTPSVTDHGTLVKDTKKNIERLKPSFSRPNARSSGFRVTKDPLRFVKSCQPIVKNRLINTNPELGKTLQELVKFSIFKCMDSLDLQTLKFLRNDIGELKARDIELVKILRKDEENIISKEFCQLYGISME